MKTLERALIESFKNTEDWYEYDDYNYQSHSTKMEVLILYKSKYIVVDGLKFSGEVFKAFTNLRKNIKLSNDNKLSQALRRKLGIV